jgi:hypothetical protein
MGVKVNMPRAYGLRRYKQREDRESINITHLVAGDTQGWNQRRVGFFGFRRLWVPCRYFLPFS